VDLPANACATLAFMTIDAKCSWDTNAFRLADWKLWKAWSNFAPLKRASELPVRLYNILPPVLMSVLIMMHFSPVFV
jgi:hypothetical protein